MRNITVVGVGYVGLVTGTCFADLGNRIVCLDIQEERIANLKKGILPIYEPGLEEMVSRNVKAGRLSFTTSYAEGVRDAEFVFIAVGTPSDVDGEADLQYVRAAAEAMAEVMDHPLIIVNKSTVPVGTGDWVADIIKGKQKTPVPFSVVSCPEFLREGSAITDFMNPDRIVLGSLDREAANRVAELHLPLRTTLVVTDLRTAEMIKYASNAFLATKISFINEIASICEALGADVKEVAAGMGFDKRIGRHFLDAGLGWGGSCFPKDVKALAHMALEKGRHPQLLRAVMDINTDQRREVIAKLKGTKRSNIFRLGDWVAVTSHVGSFQAQVARALIVLGADVAVVGGVVGGETRVSLRAGQRFYDLTGLRLGIDVAEVVAGKDGYGGGHATAASFTCKLTEEEAVQGSLDILSRLLMEKVVEVD